MISNTNIGTNLDLFLFSFIQVGFGAGHALTAFQREGEERQRLTILFTYSCIHVLSLHYILLTLFCDRSVHFNMNHET